jgi:SAM-dependent methyltransferase
MSETHYIIRGGVQGRERLRIISRILHESMAALFDRLAVAAGMRCLDVGCAGGDVTLELARRVGPGGSVVGIDVDATKIDLARREAEANGIRNVEFRVADVKDDQMDAAFDVVHARFLLTHLAHPQDVVERFNQWLRPGGLAVLVDVDFAGCFVYPESEAFRRYHELYSTVARQKGGDPDIGPRLPLLLKTSRFAEVGMAVTQPMALEGEVKLANPITMDNIADTVVTAGLASREEVASLTEQLYAFAADPLTIAGVPRIFQAWGRRPG